MMNALFIGWTAPARGKEQQAVRVFGEFAELLGTAKAKDTIKEFMPVFLSAHGGDLGGFFMVLGEPTKLDQFQTSEEFVNGITRAQICVDGMGVVRGLTGDEIQKQMARYTKNVTELAK